MYPKNVYEPDEDTYTLIDALEKEKSVFKNKIILEVGCGSGEIIEFLSNIKADAFVIGSDINKDALKTSRRRCRCDLVLSSLFDAFYQERIDVVVFNPPYVETEGIGSNDITASYSGGPLGRSVIDKFIESMRVPVSFILLSRKNAPEKVVLNIRKKGYNVRVLKLRRILSETLVAIRADRMG